jgi:hypothetical protein
MRNGQTTGSWRLLAKIEIEENGHLGRPKERSIAPFIIFIFHLFILDTEHVWTTPASAASRLRGLPVIRIRILFSFTHNLAPQLLKRSINTAMRGRSNETGKPLKKIPNPKFQKSI